MRSISALSRRLRLSTSVLKGSRSVEPFRALPVCSVAQGNDGGRRSRPGSLRATWAGAAALMGAGAVVTACDASIDQEFEPTYHKNMKDPMTIYAKNAIRRETEAQDQEPQQKDKGGEDNQQKQEDVKEDLAPQQTLQATSQKSITQPVTVKNPPGAQDEAATELVSAQATSASSALDASLAPIQPPQMTAAEVRIEEKTRKAKQHSGGLKIFSGNGNMSLALEIAKNLGINLGKATVGRFADGEVNVVIHENVRGKDVYVIQPTCTPVNDNLMELLLMVSTLRRASARRITVVIPYYGYARQDRKMQARVPISAADVARLMEAMGVDRVIAVDLHCGQIQGFFGPRVPVDNLDGGIVGLDYFGSKDLHNPVVVSPDAGGVYRAKKFKEGLEQKYDMQDIGLAMIVKQRARAGSVDQMDLVGDVKDCDCIMVDDMIDTAGTLCKAADVLVASGARRVFAFASHGLLSGPGNDRIAHSKMEEVVILNTIPTSPQRAANEKLTELSVAPLLAQAIFNIHAKKSISALFK
ncbi:Ribose-phosphate pyrophosphokinase [Seminavis robusta]|uniref:Ribose-phosphate pyrophosphokinase 2 n=1 Tax=Seminavis robusta TaxID=568900 RepID=A0A9N8H6M4_9STRA|nr:Ribose-phosphate pyrophosphokinase [Seminavis robusta]|eukprot:Sro151_g069300.1 Ribose-phosphate pyrophosphokinase (527) ;mRNA; r:93040-94784